MNKLMNQVATALPDAARIVLSILLPMVLGQARADVVVDWNVKATDILVAHRLGPAAAHYALAIVQVSVFEAANAITHKYPQIANLKLDAPAGASIDAAVAAANRSALSSLAPSQQAVIDAAYQSALALVPDGPAKVDGIAVGERAAAATLAQRANDDTPVANDYRPMTSPGVYVPTTLPVSYEWPHRRPWVMSSPDQFRPGPPPELKSELWARDYNEIKALGGKMSTRRTPEQTDIARFWEATAPTVYYPVIRSVANMPGREVTRNARLLSACAQAITDAGIAVFDAKYHYNFWRPITAIRNGDQDGNDATERDPTWQPFIDTPMHPEYPCAHCIVSATIGAVLQGDLGNDQVPTLTTTSPTALGKVRSWTSIADFTQEVSNARIYDGVHYRNSTEVGAAMGKKIGELVAAKYFH